jgi:serine/threonine-protein kinase
MLCRRGGVADVLKVLDFGLVKELQGLGDPLQSQQNTLTGTPMYLAPESLLAPDSVDARTDLYALGAVAYYLVTGQNVFEGTSIVEICGHHLHTQPTPPSARAGRAVDPDLEALILCCLAKDPADRPASARDFLKRLSALDVGRWTDEDAGRWWLAHEAELSTPDVSTSRSSGDDTIAICAWRSCAATCAS